MQTRRWTMVVRVALPILAAALLASACSGSNSSTTDTSTVPAAPSATTSSSASSSGSIVVGGIQDGNYAGIDTAFEARIARLNKAGGIDGRQIKFLTELTDGDNPSTDLSDAQTLVLKDHVFAVVPISSEVLSPASTALFQQNTTPYIGWGISPVFCSNNYGFPILGCQTSTEYLNPLSFVQAAEAAGKSVKGLKLAIIGTNNAGGKAGVQLYAESEAKVGADVVYSQASVPQDGTTDFTPYVQALMASNPDMIQFATNFQTTVSLTVALRQAGYTGPLLNPTGYVPGLFASQPSLAQALAGSYVATGFPPGEENSAATAQIKADLKAAGDPTSYTLGEAVGWWSAEEFIQELQATAAKGPITQANFEKVINAGFTLKPLAGGLSGVTFPAGHVEPVGCISTLTVKGSAYSVVEPYACNQSYTVKVSG
jgi:branched-chain amino acid transport system substrate-binding protein